ncbi:MAG: carboxypeptidase regulatory-like domain-containing protein [Bacteroidales bacterium]
MASRPARPTVLGVIVALLLAAPGGAQKPAPAGGVIRGRIVAADTGLPLQHAWVSLASAVSPTLTDREGRFEFAGLNAGRYHLSAKKRAYLLLQYGQRRPGEPGKPLVLSTNQVLDIGDFALPRGSVLGGTILDDAGEPVQGVVITVMRRQFVAGAMRLVPVATARPDATVTDDLGQYRVADLPPGAYYLAAEAAADDVVEGDVVAFAPTYYPGSVDSAGAGPVFLGLGSERLDLSFPLMAGAPVAVSGVVVDSRGQPVRGTVVRSFQVIGDPAAGNGMDGPRATTRLDGSFRLARVRPGLHRLSVDITSASTGEQEHGETLITAMGLDVDTVFLATAANARAAGRVRTDPTIATPLPASKVSVVVLATSPSAPVFGEAAAPGFTFDVRGITPGPSRRFGVTGLPPGWDIATVRCAGRDITDTGVDVASNQRLTDVDIVVTDRSTELAGTVVDSDGRSVRDYTVVVFSEDRSKWVWRSRSLARASADQDGKFAITGLRAGAYYAAAFDYLEEGMEYDPGLLERLRESAVRVTLDAGEKKTVQIQIPRGDR